MKEHNMRYRHYMLFASASLFLSPPVAGSVVNVDNTSGTFVWRASFDSEVVGNRFSPFAGIELQGSTDPLRSLFYEVPRLTGSGVAIPDFISGLPGGVRVARSITAVSVSSQSGTVYETFPATTFMPGQLVAGGSNWQEGASTGWNALFLNPVRQPLLGQSPRLGFRLPVTGGFQYAFVEFDLRLTPRGDGANIFIYQPIRWAYETQANVPIVVPTPGAFGVLVLAIVPAALVRRRHSV